MAGKATRAAVGHPNLGTRHPLPRADDLCSHPSACDVQRFFAQKIGRNASDIVMT